MGKAIVSRMTAILCVVAITLLGLLAITANAQALESQADVSFTRLGGDNRFETAVKISRNGFGPSSTNAVVIATGMDFPDALAATGLAGLVKAPIILTQQNSLPSAAYDEIVRLKPSRAYIMGGTKSVSNSIASKLQGRGIKVTRVAGANRLETAVQIYKAGGTSWGKVAIIANGASFADALSVSPLSYSKHWPIFLTDAKGKLPASARSAIAKGGFTSALVVGSEKAVPASTASWLKSQGLSVKRLGGANRYATSAKIADYALSRGMSLDRMAFATGANFPDALAGGALCGKRGSVLLLVDTWGLTGLYDFMIESHYGEFERSYLLGSSSSLGGVAVRCIKAWAQGDWSYSEPTPKQKAADAALKAKVDAARKAALAASARTSGSGEQITLTGKVTRESIYASGQRRYITVYRLELPHSVAVTYDFNNGGLSTGGSRVISTSKVTLLENWEAPSWAVSHVGETITISAKLCYPHTVGTGSDYGWQTGGYFPGTTHFVRDYRYTDSEGNVHYMSI